MLNTLGNVFISTLKQINNLFFKCFSATEVTEQVILPAAESSSPSFKPHFVKSICAVQVSLPGAPQIDAYTAVLNKDSYNRYERFCVFHCVFCWSLSLTAVGQAWTQQAAWARLSIILNLPPAIAHQLWLLSDVCASPEWPNPTISPVIIELNGWTAVGIYGWHLGTGQISQPMKQLV